MDDFLTIPQKPRNAIERFTPWHVEVWWKEALLYSACGALIALAVVAGIYLAT